MLGYLLLFGVVFFASAMGKHNLMNSNVLTQQETNLKKRISSSGSILERLQLMVPEMPNVISELEKDIENYDRLTYLQNKGLLMKGLTFNIYNDEMRDGAIAFFRILQNAYPESLKRLLDWAENNFNSDLVEYVVHLAYVYTNLFDEFEILPPFINKPNHFVNGETITKAMMVKISNGVINPNEANVYQIYKNDNNVVINTNYSSWNLFHKEKHTETNYFREDIGLNSYYYGLSILHPFWMSDEELASINFRHAEHFYFSHRQLLARYRLEKLSTKQTQSLYESCATEYKPYLIHDNGLPFPTRSFIPGDWNEYKAYLSNIDIGIRECISRGIIVMPNSTIIELNEDNYIDLITKIIRANLDSPKTAKVLRSVFGYGNNEFKSEYADLYHPAPSVLHFSETSLRDPVYWNLIAYTMNYFLEFQKSLEPYNLSQYQTDEFVILDSNFTSFSTYFEYYQFNINKAVYIENQNEMKPNLIINARQKRLKHSPFTLKFTINSKSDQKGVVRLFIGPQCYVDDCVRSYSSFFELDRFIHKFDEGINVLQWSPESSARLSYDDEFNLELSEQKKKRYSMFNFPGNLLLPKGLNEGLNLTLFVIVTSGEESVYLTGLNKTFFVEVDSKPLGFPFHREAVLYDHYANNFKFYNITIFHKSDAVIRKGYFTSNLN